MPSSKISSSIPSAIHSTSDSLPAGHGQLKAITIGLSPSSTQPDTKRTQISFPIVRFSYPLKLVVSRPFYNHLNQLQIGLVYLLNYGGGLVSGDHLSIDIEIGDKCQLLCLSQGSTKVYKEKAGSVNHSGSKNSQVLYPTLQAGSSADLINSYQSTKQNIIAKIGSNATLLMLPSYVT